MEGDGTNIEWQMPGNTPEGNRMYHPEYFLNVGEESPHSSIPSDLILTPVYPNPGNSSFHFDIFSISAVNIYIYDILGREVYSSDLLGENGGRASFRWDGHSKQGLPLASGMYLIHASSENETVTQKVYLLK